MPDRPPAADAPWAACRAARPEVEGGCHVAGFGGSPEIAEGLGLLGLGGPKRATAGPSRGVDHEPMPVAGGHVVVVGDGRPLGARRATEVRVGPLAPMDEAFARDEGEGLRARDDRPGGHRRPFARQAPREGWAPIDDEPVALGRLAPLRPPGRPLRRGRRAAGVGRQHPERKPP